MWLEIRSFQQQVGGLTLFCPLLDWHLWLERGGRWDGWVEGKDNREPCTSSEILNFRKSSQIQTERKSLANTDMDTWVRRHFLKEVLYMIYMSLVNVSWAALKDSTQTVSEMLLTFLRTWCEVELCDCISLDRTSCHLLWLMLNLPHIAYINRIRNSYKYKYL